MKIKVSTIFFLLIILLVNGCSKKTTPETANPASVYCVEQGGQVKIFTDEAGNQAGYCLFPDGSMCEEWAFYHGECALGEAQATEVQLANPAAVFCEEKGGKTEVRNTPDGGEIGFCVFPDGSECDEWEFYRNECAMGSAYRAIDLAACERLGELGGDSLGVEFSSGFAPYKDPLSGESGSACQSLAGGTGADFVSLEAAADALRGVFAAQDWQEDIQYAADGPTGTATAFRNDNQLCLLSIQWQPSGDADCPANQPVTNCNLSAEQQLYAVNLTCTEKR